jgi:hypothetical protein
VKAGHHQFVAQMTAKYHTHTRLWKCVHPSYSPLLLIRSRTLLNSLGVIDSRLQIPYNYERLRL